MDFSIPVNIYPNIPNKKQSFLITWPFQFHRTHLYATISIRNAPLQGYQLHRCNVYDQPQVCAASFLQVLVEPPNGLAEGLLLGPLLLGVAQVAADSESVADTTE